MENPAQALHKSARRVVDHGIDQLNLMSITEKPPPSGIFEKVALMAAEESVELLTPVRGGYILLL